MPRPNPGPRLRLYGPDTRYGAKRRANFKQYLWYIVWSEKGNKRELPTGARRENRRAAETALSDFLIARQGGWRGTRRPDQVLIEDVLNLYGSERAEHLISREIIGYAMTPLLAFWSEQTVSAITESTCRAYARGRKRAAATVRRELSVLRAAIRYCWRQGKLTQEVPVFVDAAGPPKDIWLTRRDVALLLAAARKEPKGRLHLPLFILIGLYTGHRKTAILQLQWQPNTVGGHVDLQHGRIDFLGRRKPTKKLRANIPITPKLGLFLRLAKKRTRQYVIEADGKPLANIKRSFATACEEAAKMAEEKGWKDSAARLRKATPHTFRHTAVTWLVNKGLPLADVGEWVGMSAETVRRIYGHLTSERLSRVAAVVDRR